MQVKKKPIKYNYGKITRYSMGITLRRYVRGSLKLWAKIPVEFPRTVCLCVCTARRQYVNNKKKNCDARVTLL